MASPEKRSLAMVLIPIAFVALIGANLQQTYFARPVRSVRSVVEESAAVRAAIGSPIEVEVFGPGKLQRYTLRANDADVLTYRTRLAGPRGRAELEMLVQDVDDQGWAGTFTVKTVASPVLVDGQYRTPESRTLLEGTFRPNGDAVANP